MHRTPLLAAALSTVVLVTGCDDKPAMRVAAPAATASEAATATKGTSTPVEDPLYPQHGNPALDVLHYGLDLSWAPDTKILTGSATLRIRPVADAKDVELDFKPYALDRVTVDDSAVPDAKVTAERLVVPVAVTKDKPITLTVAYHGRPATTPMPSHRSDAEPLGLTITKEGGLFTMQEPYGAYTWYPANDQPSDKALYDVQVTVPAGWSAIAAGTPAGQKGTTFTYHSADPMAAYLQTLAVGKYQKIVATGPRHRQGAGGLSAPRRRRAAQEARPARPPQGGELRREQRLLLRGGHARGAQRRARRRQVLRPRQGLGAAAEGQPAGQGVVHRVRRQADRQGLHQADQLVAGLENDAPLISATGPAA